MKYSMVYVTTKTRKEAEKIANALLKKRLIACANIFPVRSSYWWKKKIEKHNEFAMFLKTRGSFVNKVVSAVKEMHSYLVPCVLAFSIDRGNPDFLKWIGEETKQLTRN
jgi:periplasmic divalent cation tolerance protein